MGGAIENKHRDFDLLIKAYLENNTSRFSKLINDGANVNCLDSYGKSLISGILRWDDGKRYDVEEFLNILLKNNVSLKQIGIEESLLSIMINHHTNTNCFKKLLKTNIDINSGIKFKYLLNGVTVKDEPAIFNAIKKGDSRFINLLLKNNIDLCVEDSYGQTVMNYLIIEYCKKNKVSDLCKFLKKFITLGFDPNSMGIDGNRAIHYLSKHSKNKKPFDILFGQNIDIDINARNANGDTSLKLAADNGNLPGVKYLVKKGANLDLTGRYNKNAIFESIIEDRHEIFNFLLRSGVDLTFIDKYGYNILHEIACYYRYEESIHKKYFRKIAKLHPELLNMKNNSGLTPMQILRNDK